MKMFNVLMVLYCITCTTVMFLYAIIPIPPTHDDDDGTSTTGKWTENENTQKGNNWELHISHRRQTRRI